MILVQMDLREYLAVARTDKLVFFLLSSLLSMNTISVLLKVGVKYHLTAI